MKKILTLLLFSFALVPALFAQDATSAAAFAALGAGLAIGIAALGGGIGQGLASASALEGISRNPGASDKIFVPMIIGLALIESLVFKLFKGMNLEILSIITESRKIKFFI